MASLLTDPNFWAAISAIGGAVSALAALATIWQSRQAAKEATESQRPYFVLEAPGIKQLPNSPPFRVQLTLQNAGGRVATSLEGRIFLIANQPNAQPALDLPFSVASELPPHSPTPWYNDTLQLPAQLPQHYVILGITYSDPVFEKQYKQLFCMRWDGVQNGTFHPDFVHVSNADRQQIEAQYPSVVSKYI